ncbi:hypothetical protein PQR66_39870 [Paraburkholderia agricolaris]|uniref:Uncharacterized protein n=1 Tax=Paraburkholderia agricolaris TaxID=2152888 RepID=A0ABW9A470_9BURK
MNAASVAIAAVATVAGTASSAANWLTNYLNALGNALLNGAVQQSIEMWQLDISGDDGNVELMMAGQSGDSFAQTPLSGSSFEYTESGAQPGSVQLAENGASVVEYANGTDIVTDITGFQVVLNTANNIEIDGSKNFITVQGGSSTATISGEENSVQVQSSASGSTLTLTGAGVATNTLDLQSVSGLSVHLGDAAATGLTDTSEENSSVSVDAVATGASISATTSGILALTATGLTVNLGAGQFQLAGSEDTANLGAGASLLLSGGYDGVASSAVGGTYISISEYPGAPGLETLTTSNGVIFGVVTPEAPDTISAGSDGSLTISQSVNGTVSTSTTFDASGNRTVVGYYTDGTVSRREVFNSAGVETNSASYYGDGQVHLYDILDGTGGYVEAKFDDGAAFAYQLDFKGDASFDTVFYYEGTGQVSGIVTSIGSSSNLGENATQGARYFSDITIDDPTTGALLGDGTYDPSSGALLPGHSWSPPGTSPLVPSLPVSAFRSGDALPSSLPVFPTSAVPSLPVLDGDQSQAASTAATQGVQLIQAMAIFSANSSGFDTTFSAKPVIADPTVERKRR